MLRYVVATLDCLGVYGYYSKVLLTVTANRCKRQGFSLPSFHPENHFTGEAMALILHEFKEVDFRRLSICAIIPGHQHIDHYRTNEVDWDAQDDGGHWYHLVLDVGQTKQDSGPVDHLHLHLDVVRLMGRDKSPPNKSIGDISAELSKLHGESTMAHVFAEYRIPKANLPKRGVIMSMAGISTVAGGEKLSLSGMRMSFDQSPFYELEWKYRDDDVIVGLDAFEQVMIDDHLVESVASLLEDGMQSFVLETSSEPSGTSNG